MKLLRTIKGFFSFRPPQPLNSNFFLGFGSKLALPSMDVPYRQFGVNLIKIIQHISNAHFVSLDLEFTGIPSRGMPQQGRNSIEQIYGELREAAKRYQILQVGLTIVHEDKEKGGYITRPYNFFINPVPVKERFLRLERIWSYQSGAVSFLLEHNFNFAKPFTEGIPYLSRDEEAQIRISFTGRDSDEARKKLLNDMEDKEEDKPLINHIHRSIGLWLETSPDKREDYLNIPNISEGPDESIPAVLSRYQMRLTHQTIRNHYPEFTHAGKNGFIQIREHSLENDAAERKRTEFYRERDLSQAIEFRWIIEALIGGDITRIPKPYFLMAMPNTEKDDREPPGYQEFVHSLQSKISTRKRVLVGHNLLIDLVYVYQTFVGNLPPTLAEFVALIHNCFPTILDTKQLASLVPSLQSAALKSTALEALATAVSEQRTPRIDAAEGFERYSWLSAFHEAGYDAYLTAQVAIKLSAQIAGAPKFQSEKAVTAPNPSKDKAVSTKNTKDPATEIAIIAAKLESLSLALQADVENQTTAQPARTDHGNDFKSTVEAIKSQSFDWSVILEAAKSQLEKAVVTAQAQVSKSPAAQSEYQRLMETIKATPPGMNLSDILAWARQSLTSFGGVGTDGITATGLGNAESKDNYIIREDENDDGGVSLIDEAPGRDEVVGQAETRPQDQLKGKIEMMPPWEQTQIWDVMGNKLCVGGSVEGVLDIRKTLTTKAEAEAGLENETKKVQAV